MNSDHRRTDPANRSPNRQMFGASDLLLERAREQGRAIFARSLELRKKPLQVIQDLSFGLVHARILP